LRSNALPNGPKSAKSGEISTKTSAKADFPPQNAPKTPQNASKTRQNASKTPENGAGSEDSADSDYEAGPDSEVMPVSGGEILAVLFDQDADWVYGCRYGGVLRGFGGVLKGFWGVLMAFLGVFGCFCGIFELFELFFNFFFCPDLRFFLEFFFFGRWIKMIGDDFLY
jgi:hypothetical protein